MARKKVPVLQVVAKRDGFRRAGIRFGSEPINVPIADLKKDQVTAIKAEPMLIAVETEVEVDEVAAAA
jgi:hypothetical protein